MIYLKTDEEIELMRLANQLVGKTLAEVAKHITPGVTTLQLDKVAEEFIRDNGAVPAFLVFLIQYVLRLMNRLYMVFHLLKQYCKMVILYR